MRPTAGNMLSSTAILLLAEMACYHKRRTSVETWGIYPKKYRDPTICLLCATEVMAHLTHAGNVDRDSRSGDENVTIGSARGGHAAKANRRLGETFASM